jgi:hypothetical protein
MLFERTTDLHSQLEEMKLTIQSLVDGTSIDHSDLIIQSSQLQDDTVDVFQNNSNQPPSSSVIDDEDEQEGEDETSDL